MTSNAAALAATIILLFPMGYFFLPSPAFLLVRLDIPQVTQLLRGMFNVHFVAMSIAGVIGTLAFAGGSTGFRHRHWPGCGFRDSRAALVYGPDGCPAERQGRRRCRRGTAAAPAALGRHAVQCGPARRFRKQHSLRHVDLIRLDHRG